MPSGSRAAEAGPPFTDTVVLPLLPENPTPEEYLRFAFLRNADLHTRYWEWRAAIERVPQDSSFPNVALPFSVLFSGGNMKLWDRTTLGLSNDPMSDIPFPTKLSDRRPEGARGGARGGPALRSGQVPAPVARALRL